MAVVGKRTSVYLSDDLAAAVAGSGLPLAKLVRRGLAAAGMTLEAGPGALGLRVPRWTAAVAVLIRRRA
jgi:hypothetical protein